MENLLEYLIYFFQRIEPLQDFNRIFSKVEAEFEEQWADGQVQRWQKQGQENEDDPAQHTEIDLDYYNTVEELMEVGPEKLKEAIMARRMVATINANGDICAIQKAGEGVSQSVIMQCLQLATIKAAGITKQIKQAVEAYNSERALQKIKRETTCVGINVEENQNQSVDSKGISDFSSHVAKADK